MFRQRLFETTVRDLLKLAIRPYLVRPFFFGPNRLDNRFDFLRAITGQSLEQLSAFEREFLLDHETRRQINERLIQRRQAILGSGISAGVFYMLVRSLRPSLMIETGVFDGITTAVILQALRDNGHGKLISIDLPAISEIKDSTVGMPTGRLPEGCNPGWVIPDCLREWHELVLGDSKTELPQVLQKYPEIDIFFHDSLHTENHMAFEYETAWPRLRDGGILLSDDVFALAAKNVFFRFARNKGKPFYTWANLGAIVKR